MANKHKHLPPLPSEKAAEAFVAKSDLSKHIPSAHKPKRIGFLDGEIEVPDDFDTMSGTDVVDLFTSLPTKPSD